MKRHTPFGAVIVTALSGAVAALGVIALLHSRLLGLGLDGLPAWIVGVGLVGAVMAYAVRVQRFAAKDLLDAKVVRLDSVDVDLLGAGESPIAQHLAGDQDVGYVSRDLDDDLADLLRKKRIVVITGIGGSGKSRSAYHAACQVAPRRKVLIPRRPDSHTQTPLSDVLSMTMNRIQAVGPCWLWIDDLDSYIGDVATAVQDDEARDILELGQLNRWLKAHRARRVVITLREGDEHSKLGPRASSLRKWLEAQGWMHHHPMPDEWSASDWERGLVAYPGAHQEPGHDEQPRSLSRILSRDSALVRRYDGASAVRRTVVDAAVDWKRCGREGPVPLRWLVEGGHISRSDRFSSSDTEARVRKAIEWLSGSVESECLLWPAADNDRYEVAHVLVEESRRRDRPLRGQSWECLEIEPPTGQEELMSVAIAARDAGRSEIAKRALNLVMEGEGFPRLQSRARKMRNELLAAERELHATVLAASAGPGSSSGTRAGGESDDARWSVTDQLDVRTFRRSVARWFGLIVADVLGVWVGLILGFGFDSATSSGPTVGEARAQADQLLPVAALLVVVLFARADLYVTRSRRGTLSRVIGTVTLAALCLVALALLTGSTLPSLATVIVAVVTSCLAIGGMRWLFAVAVAGYRRRQRGGRKRVALLGDPQDVEEVGRHLDDQWRDIVGYVYLTQRAPTRPCRYELLGGRAAIPDLVEERGIEELLLCEDVVDEAVAGQLAEAAWGSRIRLEAVGARANFLVGVNHYLPGEAISLRELRLPAFDGGQAVAKRAFDVTMALVIGVVSSPVWILAAILIKSTSAGPLLAPVEQPGYRGTSFSVLKFRTRREHVSGRGAPTLVGQVLSRLGFDEIPQLLNVLRGEMSLVGPRPISPSDFDRLKGWEVRRHLVPPGITGLWQIAGRTDHELADMARLDLEYVERWSPYLDVEILLKTFGVALSGRRSTFERASPRGSVVTRVGGRRGERRAPFASTALAALASDEGASLDELAVIAQQRGADSRHAVVWLARLDTIGWLSAVDGKDHAAGAKRVGLTDLARGTLREDPREALTTSAGW